MNLHQIKRIADAVTAEQAAQNRATGKPFDSLGAFLHSARATTVGDREAAVVAASVPAREGCE